ncbi:MAG: hypothetical protein KF767_11820 [Bdellovibrionaceae bacterium]|nr:hypothetical protein [Pseudobdellovibrionaceae bacterium]
MGAPKIKETREDVLTTKSEKAGAHGFFESLLRRFRGLSFALLLTPLTVVCVSCIGVSMAPGLWLFSRVNAATAEWAEPLHFLALGLALATGYLMYGFTLMVVVPLVNFLMPFRVKPFRGPYYSLPAIPWYIHNALTYMVRFTFLEFVTPTPLNVLFYRMMGMKIGKGVVINTTAISDPCMIELGDYVTIGGSATIFGHYGQKGYLVIAPVKIEKGANIGLKASVMGGCEVGENTNIKPHAALLPKTKVPANENFG